MDNTYGWYKNGKRSPDPVACKWCGTKPTNCGQILYCGNKDCKHNPPHFNQGYDEWQRRNNRKNDFCSFVVDDIY